MNIINNISSESVFIMGDLEPYSGSDDNESTGLYWDIYDFMYDEDADYSEADKENNSYLIGSCYLQKYGRHEGSFSTMMYGDYNDNIYLDISLSCKLFYKYKFKEITGYLKAYSYGGGYHIDTLNKKTTVDIMQLKFEKEGQFCHSVVIIKTFWLRLVQRIWKNVFKKRREIEKERSKPSNIKYREIHGKFPDKLNVYPSLKGMCFYIK